MAYSTTKNYRRKEAKFIQLIHSNHCNLTQVQIQVECLYKLHIKQIKKIIAT